MKIDIWSDIVCPFCYIGKRHLEQALAGFDHADDVHITWHSFELDPNAPTTPQPDLAAKIAQKYGLSREQAVASQEQIAAAAEAVGLQFNWREAQFGNTFDAHRLVHLAASHALADAAHERLMRAYFTEGADVVSPASLAALATEIGLPADEVDALFASDRFTDEVRADERAAAEIGISGVPFFVFDEKYAISGAQPVEVFSSALRRTWDEAHASRGLIDIGETGDACGPDGC